jgi:hypothetical protein
MSPYLVCHGARLTPASALLSSALPGQSFKPIKGDFKTAMLRLRATVYSAYAVDHGCGAGHHITCQTIFCLTQLYAKKLCGVV